MKVLCETQRTPEWFEAKRGCISASSAHIALMGNATKTRRLYVQKLADDLEGIPDFADEDDPPWFRDGIYYESWARGWYSFQYDVDVRETGFVVHDDYSWIGCSPDGLIDPNGMCEIKYRKFLHTFKDHAAAEATRTVIAQIQTQMFVCDRRWCDYINYWRSDEVEREQGHVQRIHRDDAYINNALLPAFVSLWADVMTECRRRNLIAQAQHG